MALTDCSNLMFEGVPPPFARGSGVSSDILLAKGGFELTDDEREQQVK
jgi:hypothetical protein